MTAGLPKVLISFINHSALFGNPNRAFLIWLKLDRTHQFTVKGGTQDEKSIL
ncbi:hypothetical protein [Anaerosolibacter sp.]|jgi:hypothetical protein|uniref:hypothetical protein n=1 Tax=Anaerosolibacter sp. TaxID=1872527 RepID=UPI002633784D|nr:hypothetical protein [Anaerosolibacter sp.]